MDLKHRILPIVFLLFFSSLSAQVNIKVGYSIGYTNPKSLNEIVDEFNENRDWLDVQLKNVHTWHGLQLGVRYRIEEFAFELAWNAKFKSLSSSGIAPNESNTSYRDLYFGQNTLSLGYEYFIENLSFGASLDGEAFRIRSSTNSSGDRFKVSNQFGYASHFFVSYTFPSSRNIHLALRPYVQVPWSSYKLDKLVAELEGTGLDKTTKLLNFGIAFIFYNGPHY